MAVRSSSGMKTSRVARHHDLDARLLLQQRLSRAATSSVSSASLMPFAARPDRGRRGRRRSRSRETPSPSCRDSENLPSELADGSAGGIGDAADATGTGRQRLRPAARRRGSSRLRPPRAGVRVTPTATATSATIGWDAVGSARVGATVGWRLVRRGRAAAALKSITSRIRTVEREHAVAVDALHVEDDARRVLRMPAEPDLAHDVVVELAASRPAARAPAACP